MSAKKHIYFMRPIGQLGPIKIGCSSFVEYRLIQVATWSPIPLEIIHMEEGDHKLERNLHRCFADYHSHLEWFHPGDRLLAAISKLRAGAKIADAVDLTDEKRTLLNASRRQIVPELEGYKSYAMKIVWAVKRAERTSKAGLYTPNDVDLIMNKWIGQFGYHIRRPPVRPTDAEFKRLQQFIEAPHLHCVTRNEKFPRKSRSVTTIAQQDQSDVAA